VDQDNQFVRDEQGLVTVTVGAKQVTFKELNGRESRWAESLAFSQTAEERAYARMPYAIRDIDGVKFDPKEQADLDRVSGRFTASEQDVALMTYTTAFRNEVLEEQVKKLVELMKLAAP
jgi:hypothetical protein